MWIKARNCFYNLDRINCLYPIHGVLTKIGICWQDGITEELDMEDWKHVIEYLNSSVIKKGD